MPEDKKPPQTKGKAGEIAKLLRDANNVLVITSRDPSVDQLSASIGLALALNKSGKHVSAVYSGTTPSIIDFLEPGKTLDKNTDSLRDFIISLDRSKADKLRYKVEDEIVRIFITPYKASISDKDLDFSQGDFNIDLIIALGVHDNGDLDNAITAHGRILHDAKIINITNADQPNEFGTDHWNEQKASSLSEMTTNLVELVSKDILDNQSATAFLTGVVYETDRFKNEKATPETMETAGVLMGAGASTQLVADKLEEDKPEPAPETPDEPEENQELPESEDSSSQEPNEPSADERQQSDPDDVEEEVTEIPDIEEKPEEEPKKQEPDVLKIDHDDQIHIDDAGKLHIIAEEEKAVADQKER